MSVVGIVIRLFVFLLAILVATWISAAIREALDIVVMPRSEAMVRRSILIATGVFIVLLAIPFVPAAEIGLTMLMVFGAEIAPLVYAATVTALMLAYTIGRVLPTGTVVRGLQLLGLNRAAVSVGEIAALPEEERLERLMDGSSPQMLRFATRFRFLAILVAINLPGNVLIGGGGGIAMMAGISGLCAPLPFLLAISLAVAPIPLAVMLFGA